jgi:CDP-4-dehydro-6-deoxyglucose reductase
VFEVAGGGFKYEPGHVIDLFVPVPGRLAMKRAYSIASAPGFAGPGALELAVTLVPDGPASTALHALEPGATLEADGPRGSFLRWPAERDQRTLFVATGSGLAPLRAMMQTEFARGDGPPVSLLFGCRTENDILWGTELRTWEARHSRFSLAVTLSRASSSWTGRRGWVQSHLVELVAVDAPERVFVCGLTPMVEEVRRILGTLGLPSSAVRTETFDT